ncbi:WGR domain-containing protein [Pelagibius sp. Alg239-R121]|uniref:WGR domain-containing protein n=1 Tax=Pelagibius sp. Alg239-R121 TaxID=2993448 RepID=UPI0024A62055|nr:WGR domain-containing protein [Pelagibius sp. Alg239-R121]
MFPASVLIHRVDPARNMRRFYRMQLQPNLFSGCTLVREWGRIGTTGQCRNDLYADEGRAVSAMIALSKQKRQRGYC